MIFMSFSVLLGLFKKKANRERSQEEFKQPVPNPAPAPPNNPDHSVEPQKGNLTVKVFASSQSTPNYEELWRQHHEEKIQEIKKLREQAVPTKSGLFPHEILMIHFASRYEVGGKKFPQFWLEKYAVENPEQVLKSLEQRGFVCVAPIADGLQNMKVPQLKEILRANGLKVSGAKDDLVKRISENIAEETLQTTIKERYYTATELGKKELEENQYVPYIHKYPYSNITIWRMSALMQKYPAPRWKDAIWGEIQRLKLEEMKRGNFPTYLHYQEVEFLMEENRMAEAFRILFILAYEEVNRIIPQNFKNQLETYNFFRQKYPNLKPKNISALVSMSCGTTFRNLSKCHEAINDGNIDFSVSLCESWNVNGCQDALFSKQEFIDIIVAFVSDDLEKFNLICDQKQKILESGG